MFSKRFYIGCSLKAQKCYESIGHNQHARVSGLCICVCVVEMSRENSHSLSCLSIWNTKDIKVGIFLVPRPFCVRIAMFSFGEILAKIICRNFALLLSVDASMYLNLPNLIVSSCLEELPILLWSFRVE